LARCKKCNFEAPDLIWDKPYHEITGKWRLLHSTQGRPHDCQPKVVIDEPAEVPKPLVKCPKCDPLLDSAWMKPETLQNHIKVEHFGFW
tara:strand:+ start:298 stop:564 length:267 start_codon:yes stop_codon:yes gene_type:complete